MVSWTAENDAKVFVAVLKVHDAPISHARVAEELKKMGLDVTAKAVSHRIAKLKNDAKGGKAPSYSSSHPKNAPSFLDVIENSESVKKMSARPSTPKTPKNPKNPKTPKKATTHGTPGTANTDTKRKRLLEDIGFHTEDGVRVGDPNHPVSKKQMLLSTWDSMENQPYTYDEEMRQASEDEELTPVKYSPTKAYSPILKSVEITPEKYSRTKAYSPILKSEEITPVKYSPTKAYSPILKSDDFTPVKYTSVSRTKGYHSPNKSEDDEGNYADVSDDAADYYTA